MHNKIMLLIIAVLISKPVLANNNKELSFICIEDKTTGFFYSKEKKVWETTNFKPQNKYLVKIKEKMPSIASATITEFGYPDPILDCKISLFDSGELSCHGTSGNFFFSVNTLRFIKAFMLGYIEGKDNNKSTPNITIGKCSPI